MKDGVSLSLKDHAILRKIEDYTVFQPPKPLHFSALFSTKISPSCFLFAQQHSATFFSYNTKNVVGCIRMGVSLSLLPTNPNTTTISTIPQLEEREKNHIFQGGGAEGQFCTIMCPWQ